MKGVYAVFFETEEQVVEIGALGEKRFKSGTYVYIGSAMNGVEKRLERHFSSDKKLHWHIDYFSVKASPVYYIIFPLESRFECLLADEVAEKHLPVKDFGASDCDCSSHLFRVGEKDMSDRESIFNSAFQ